jgi:hypothetical protein
MGFLDKLKGAMQAVTGGAAKLSFEELPPILFPGEPSRFRLSATSAGAEVKSQGVFVDLLMTETAKFTDKNNAAVEHSEQVFARGFQVAPAFVLAPGETKVFEFTFAPPEDCRPTYDGKLMKNRWQLQGRIEAAGNDPDTGFTDIRLGLKR